MPAARRTITALAASLALCSAWAGETAPATVTPSEAPPPVMVGDLNAMPMDSRHAGGPLAPAADEEGSGLARAALLVSLGALAFAALRRRK